MWDAVMAKNYPALDVAVSPSDDLLIAPDGLSPTALDERLGAARAVGIDNDSDAIQSARESLELNPEATHVTFDVADLRSTTLPRADVVTANLTGALLIRAAGDLLGAVVDGGVLIVSGLL